MDNEAVLWVRVDELGVEHRCTVTLIGEGEFELRLSSGEDLVLSEDFDDEERLLDRAAELEAQGPGIRG